MLPEPLLALRPGWSGRVMLPELLAFAAREGIVDRIRELSPFRFEELSGALCRDPGYDLARGNRARMIRLLVDLLVECRWLERGGDRAPFVFRLAKVPPAGDPSQDRRGDEGADGQVRFLRRCLALAPEYLRGREPSITFGPDSVAVWEDFLGCEEFQACRTALFDRMARPAAPPLRLLDLCHGPGWGVERAMERCPGARISAIEFTDAFAATALRRAEQARARSSRAGVAAVPVAWFGPSDWRGFGSPLPFADESFDAVLFGCGDPYIPSRSREGVYLELRRILAPGGMLGVLTRGYPDPAARYVSSFWLRVTALIHDFAESVCAGWQGFRDVEESIRMFTGIGFVGAWGPTGEMSIADSSVWLMRKG